MGAGGRLERWSAGCLLGCPLGAGVQGYSCYFADVSKNVLMLLLFGVFPAFSCSALGALPLNMALFRVLGGFLAWFVVVVWVCLACALFVACVAFCARVELGGLKTCCVFAFLLSVFLLLCIRCIPFALSFVLCPSLLWLSLLVLLHCLCCFFFPYGQERAQRFCSLRPLSSCVMCV